MLSQETIDNNANWYSGLSEKQKDEVNEELASILKHEVLVVQMEEFIKTHSKSIIKVVACGSWVVCDPPVTDTDKDFLVHVHDVKAFGKELRELGYTEETDSDPASPSGSRPTLGDGNPDHRFSSWRLRKLNLIVTESKAFAKKHECATNVCRKLNLLKKEDRIMVYKAILYGEFKA